MSKELEQRVEELILKETVKKEVAKQSYAANKEYDRLYQDVLAMVKSGHTVPSTSAFHVELVTKESGRVSDKYVLEQFVEKHPQYAKTVQDLRAESKKQPVEKLEYGVRERPSP